MSGFAAEAAFAYEQIVGWFVLEICVWPSLGFFFSSILRVFCCSSSRRCWGYANVRIGNLRLTYQVQKILVRTGVCLKR